MSSLRRGGKGRWARGLVVNPPSSTDRDSILVQRDGPTKTNLNVVLPLVLQHLCKLEAAKSQEGNMATHSVTNVNSTV